MARANAKVRARYERLAELLEQVRALYPEALRTKGRRQKERAALEAEIECLREQVRTAEEQRDRLLKNIGHALYE